ncbi:MAG TPA: hypothetical protein VEQ34_01170 [Pyrinomonadaceae bacterium]|nr:hypothetical protein [Pyrinomonadaceae bacterium]
MEKKPEQIHDDQWLKDVSIEPEIQGFRAEEMISCPKCERKSPPTRLKCFYCGAELPVTAEQAEFIKPQPRKMEVWEKGFNLIILPNAQTSDDAKTAEVAAMTRLEREDLKKIIDAQKPLPLVRADSEKEAGIIRKRLSETGFEVSVLSDEDLKIETVTRRLRGIEFGGDEKIVLILFNSDEIAEIRREDLVLIVTGAQFERRIETTEQRKKRENKVLESTETSADELLIDIYTRGDAIGYRIVSNGFDFSCLAAEKGILARENMQKLTEKLRAFAPQAKFVGDYLQVRDHLGKVWEVEEKRTSRGLQRKSFGRFDFGNVTTINNLSQFTKYSRLQWHLL